MHGAGKKRMYDARMSLVFDGRQPAFAKPVQVSRSWNRAKERFLELANDSFDTSLFTNDGPFVHEFEQRIAALHDVRHCVAVNSGTTALQISLKAMHIEGKVLMPSFTFIGTAHAAKWMGCTPVFCDIDPHTLTMDPQDALRRMEPGVTCLLPVNLFGHACDFSGIENIAHTLKLRTLYDSAHCIGCSSDGHMIGAQGDMQILSFHATKMLHTFEGGAILTNDDALAHEARLIRNYGFTGYEQVERLGTNGKMTEIAAAHGLASLPDLPHMLAANHKRRTTYRQLLHAIPGITLVEPPVDAQTNEHYLVIRIDEERYGMSCDTLYRLLWAEHIQARRYFAPGCHRLAPYNREALSLPVTERVAEEILCLPTGIDTPTAAIATICSIIREAGCRAEEVCSWTSVYLSQTPVGR